MYALSSYNNNLKLWDVNTGACLRTFTGHSGLVSSVAFSPDGLYALSSSLDKTLRLWDVNTGSCIRTFTGHTNTIWTVDYSSDGKYALSGSDDMTLKLWDINTGTCIRTLNAHSAGVNTVVFSPDVAYALSGSNDQVVILWDVNTGSYIKVFYGHTRDINSVDISDQATVGFKRAGFSSRSIIPHTISAYPNPFTSRLTLELPTEAKVYSITGQLIISLKKGKQVIDTSRWQQGVYIIKAGALTKRIVKVE